MQDLVSSGCLTDKGFPLTCTPKENTFRINSPNPTQANNQTKESLLSHIDTTIQSITSHQVFMKIENLKNTLLFHKVAFILQMIY